MRMSFEEERRPLSPKESAKHQSSTAYGTSTTGYVTVEAKFGSCGDLLRSLRMRAAIGTLALFVAIILLFVAFSSNGGIFVALAAVCCFVIYFFEAFTCELVQQLPDLCPVDEALLRLEEWKKKPPVHWWSIQNYRLKDTLSGDVRVATHFEQGSFVFQKWNDHSPPLRDAHEFAIVELNFKVESNCANPLTKQQYEYQSSEFQNKHQVETLSDFDFGVVIRGMRQRMLCMGSGSFLLSAVWFYAFSFFGLSLFYRIWAHSKTGVAHYTFVKEVFSDPSAPTHIKYKTQPLTPMISASDVFYSDPDSE